MNLDQLRLTFGMAHAMPSVDLYIRCEDGHTLTASHTPGADISLCVMRQVTMASRLQCQPDHLDRIEHVDFGPGVIDLGAGVVFSEASGCHFFGSYLTPAAITELAHQVVPENVKYDIRPDAGLEMSTIRFARSHPSPDRPTYSIARRLHEECLQFELASSIRLASEIGVGGSQR